jgi:hypothetical protein
MTNVKPEAILEIDPGRWMRSRLSFRQRPPVLERLMSVCRWPVLCALVLCVMTGELSAQPSKTAGKLPPLERPTTVKWDNISLEEVVEDLREKHDFEVSVDRTSIENEGLVTSNIKINLDLRNITLRSILWLALDTYRLELIEKEDGYLITSRPVAEATFTDREYDLKVLGANAKDPQVVTDVIRAAVIGEFWKDSDGFGGTIEVDGKTLKVNQIPSAHDQITELFRQIEVEMATKKPADTPREVNENRWRATLAKKATKKLMVEGETTLQEVITKCSGQFELFLWMDGPGMKDAGMTMNASVTPEVKGTTAGEMMTSILEPLGLGYVIEHEAVLITSKEKASLPNRLRVFNTKGKGVKVKEPAEKLAEKIRESDQYGKWDEGGGMILPLGTLLVVRQTPAALDEIGKMIAK